MLPVPSPATSVLPSPKSWDEFEDIVSDIYARRWRDLHAVRNGRGGQRQHGVDIYGQPEHLGGRYAGVQCKRFEDGRLTKKKLLAEIAAAERFSPPLAEYTVATTERRDAALQQAAREINEQRARDGAFPVHIASWEDLCGTLVDPNNRDLFAKHYLDSWSAFAGSGVLAPYPDGLADDIVRRYNCWLEESTATFPVPGLGVALPIETAWIRLGARRDRERDETPRPTTIEEWIARYHEWERLAERADDTDDTFDAEHLVDLARRVVVVAGSGAGKSTLLKRVAHHLSGAGHRVLRVRLPLVAAVLRETGDIDRALLRVAVAGSGISEADARHALDHPDYLLADGLDECDPDRALVASALTTWAAGHPETGVVAATRPVGYDPGAFPGWEHAELLPLNKEDIRRYARQLISARLVGDAAVARPMASFERQLEHNRAASLAARNPLLLGFLVDLCVDDVDLGHSRAALYDHILERAYRRPLHDREAPPPVSHPVARFVLGAAGWYLIDRPALSRPALIDLLGADVAHELDCRPLQAQAMADETVRFWEERGIIERLTLHDGEAVAFVHRSLCEYAAGHHAAQFDDDDLRAWLTRVRRESRWREAVLLAAGSDTAAADRIATHLLQLDDPIDPTSTEAVLAAAALAEVPHREADTLGAVAGRLEQRLTSAMPSIAYEAAAAALGLASLAPDIIGPIAAPLVDHQQQWTRIAAVRLALACGDHYIDSDAVEAFVDDVVADRLEKPNPLDLGQWWRLDTETDFLNDSVLHGLERLTRERLGIQMHDLVDRVISGHAVSIGTYGAVLTLLRQAGGYEDILAREGARIAEATRNLRSMGFDRERMEQADRAFLNAVRRATGGGSSRAPVGSQREPLALGALIHGMRWLKRPVYAWEVLAWRRDEGAVDSVLRSTIAALGIDARAVDEDAAWALENLDTIHGEALSGGIIGRVRDLPSSHTWEANRVVRVPREDLVRALAHPSPVIAMHAAQLLYNGAAGPDIGEPLRVALQSSKTETLRLLARMAPYVWKDDAWEVVLERLVGPLDPGCRYLLEALPGLPGSRGTAARSRWCARRSAPTTCASSSRLQTPRPRSAVQSRMPWSLISPEHSSDGRRRACHAWCMAAPCTAPHAPHALLSPLILGPRSSMRLRGAVRLTARR